MRLGKSALTEINSFPEYMGKSINCRRIKAALELLCVSLASNKTKANVVSFSDHLVSKHRSIGAVLVGGKGKKSISARRLKMWKLFHSYTTSSLYKQEWILFLDSLRLIEIPFAVISQHVASVLLKKMIAKLVPQRESDVADSELSIDEDQAVRYTSGYVVRSLKGKLSRMPDSEKYIEVLNTMYNVEDDVDADNFMEYTKEWIAKVDRGGLYKVSDETFLLFKAMELTIRKFLQGKEINITTATDEILSLTIFLYIGH